MKRFRNEAPARLWRGENSIFSLYKKEKQNLILFKSWDNSPKRKTCISANVCVYLMFLDFSLSLLFNCKEKERNMGRATAGASQIYAVVRPERNEVERECNEARLKGASKFFYPYYLFCRQVFFCINC